MPFTTKETTLNISSPTTEKPVERDDLGFMDVIGDAFHIDNPVVALFKDKDEIKDPASNFNVVNRLKEDNISPDIWESFYYVDNEQEYKKTIVSVGKDLEARERLSEAGFSGLLASMTASLASPSLFLGGGAISTAIKSGQSVAKTAALTATIAGSTIFAEEKLLQSTQAGRSNEEVALNTSVGFLMAGMLGGAAGGLTNIKYNQAAKGLKEKLAVDGNIEKFPESLSDFANFDKSLSAAEADQTSIFNSLGLQALNKEQLGIAKASNPVSQVVLDGYLKMNKAFNPSVRMMQSSSKTVRQTYLELTDASIKPQGIKEGFELPGGLENVLKRKYSDYGLEVAEFGNNWKTYKSSGGELNYKEFREEIGKAFPRVEEHTNPLIAKTVSQFKDYYAKIGKELVDLKLLPEDILNAEEAAKYLNRVYKTQRIQQNIPAFKKSITPYMRRQLTSVRNKLEGQVDELDETGNATKEALDAKEQIRKYFDEDVFEDYLNESVNSITNNILKNSDITGFKPIVAGSKGPLKKRSFNIPDEEIQDYLETDILYLSDKYTRQVVPEIEIRKQFGETGIEDRIKQIQKEYDDLQENASPKESARLDKERKEILKDLDSTFNLLRGTYKGFGGNIDDFTKRASDSILTFNYLTGLGGVVLSSIPDIGMGVLRRGFSNFFGDSLKPYVESLVKNSGQLTKNEARSYSQALEVVSSSRTQSLFSIRDPMAFGTPFERGLGWLGNKMSNVNLINYWNDSFQQIASLGTRFRVVNNIEDFVKSGKLNSREEEFMNFIGIGSEKRVGMQVQMSKYGETSNGYLIPNVDKWDDKVLRNAFKDAIGKEVDRTLISKGVSDIPRFGNTQLGKMIFQWQNFTFAFNNKAIINGLIDSDARTLAGISFLVSLGMVSESLKNKIAGKENPDNAAKWIDAGLDKSGLIGILNYGNSFANIAGLDYKGLLEEAPTLKSKFGAKNALDVVLGPTGKNLHSASMFAASLPKEGMTQKDLHRLRTLTPLQNVFYLKPLFDKFEKEVGKDLPEHR